MPDPIQLTVQEDESVSLSPEELRVVTAVSPEATVEENDDGAEIVIKDLAHGTTRAQIYNGNDGFSPTVKITPYVGGADITITDVDGPHSIVLHDGTDGRGIYSAALNSDYTLTITYTDGSSYTTPSIRGERGNGIVGIIKTGSSGLEDTYTISYTNGQTSTFTVTNGRNGTDGTPGQDGVSPAITVTDIPGGHRITITDAEHPNGQTVDVMDGENGSDGLPGTPGSNGVDGTTFSPSVSAAGDLSWSNDGGKTNPPTVNIKGATGAQGPPGEKGDPGDNYVLTAQDKADIAGMVDAPVQDVQVDGTSILTAQGVANVPMMTFDVAGVIKKGSGLVIDAQGRLNPNNASDSSIKTGTSNSYTLTPGRQHLSTFYGLAKAAGDTTQSASSNEVGTYTDTAIDKIMQMLGIDALIGPHEGATASAAKSIGDVFIYSGKLYKATSGIAYGEAIVPGTNCAQTNLINLIRGM